MEGFLIDNKNNQMLNIDRNVKKNFKKFKIKYLFIV